MSTRYLAAEFPNAAVTGLDLSPYFLAVAELRERQLGGGAGQRQRITYLHRDMEHTGLPDASCDVVSVQFVTHECPAHIIRSLVGGRVGVCVGVCACVGGGGVGVGVGVSSVGGAPGARGVLVGNQGAL